MSAREPVFPDDARTIIEWAKGGGVNLATLRKELLIWIRWFEREEAP